MDLYLLQKYIGSGKWKISKVATDREEAALWDMCGDENAVLKLTLSDMSEGRILFMDIDRGLWVFSGEDKGKLDVLSPSSLPVVNHVVNSNGSVNILIAEKTA